MKFMQHSQYFKINSTS